MQSKVLLIAVLMTLILSSCSQLGAISLPADGKVVSPVSGYMECKATGAMTNWVPGTVYTGPIDYHFTYNCNDLSSNGNGCNVRFTAVCKDGTQNYLYYRYNAVPDIYNYRTASSANTDPALTLKKDQSITVYLSCYESGFLGIRDFAKPQAGGFDYRKGEYGIYLYTEGYGSQGLISSSLPECSYVSSSTDIKALFDAQKSGDNLPIVGTNLPLGRTNSFTVGWQEVPLAGNVNPAGQYNGKDVICQPDTNGAKISQVNALSTNGGNDYFIVGSVLGQGASYCCPGSVPCSSPFVCENYKCVQKATCTNGQCNAWQKDTWLDKNNCELQSGSYFTFDRYCDTNACIQIQNKATAKCCPGSCGLGKICDINAGCVDAQVLKVCPVGECCIEGGDWQKQSCSSGLNCCYDLGDAFRGSCKSQCTLPPDESIKKQNCEAQGGKYVEVNSKQCTLGIFCTTTTKSDCYIPYFSIIGLVMSVLGIAGIIYGKKADVKPIMIIGIVLIALAIALFILGAAGINLAVLLSQLGATASTALIIGVAVVSVIAVLYVIIRVGL